MFRKETTLNGFHTQFPKHFHYKDQGQEVDLQALGFQETVPELAITVFTYMRPRVYASIAVAHKWFLHVYICAQGLTNE